MIIQKFFLSLLVGLLVFISGSAGAQEQQEEIVRVKEIKISGEISYIGASYISLIYKREDRGKKEYEVMLLLNSDVEFVRKDLEELGIGDKVLVKCEDHFKLTEEGEELFDRRVTKEIKFLSPSIKGQLIGKERQRR